MMKYYIGIDYGASSLCIMLECNDGKRFQVKTFSDAYSIYGAGGVSGRILASINGIIQDNCLESKDCKGICIGVAGARKVSQQAEIEKALRLENAVVKSDGEIALYSAFGESDGAILICGTGSAIYGKSDGKLHRSGGWGRIIGDVGSGYEIGLMVLRTLSEEYDRYKKICYSSLSKRIYDKFKIHGENLITKVYQEGFDIASIAKFIIEDSEEDTYFYLRLGAERLVEQINIFQSNFKKEFPLVFSGSLIRQKNRYSELLKKMINEKCEGVKVMDKDIIPEEGAIYLAKKYFK